MVQHECCVYSESFRFEYVSGDGIRGDAAVARVVVRCGVAPPPVPVAPPLIPSPRSPPPQNPMPPSFPAPVLPPPQQPFPPHPPPSSPPPPAATDVELLFEGQACGSRFTNLGTDFRDVHECANAAALTVGCGTHVQWSERFNVNWGCTCCSPGGETGGNSNQNWAVYRFSFQSPSPHQPPMAPPPPSPPSPPLHRFHSHLILMMPQLQVGLQVGTTPSSFCQGRRHHRAMSQMYFALALRQE